PTAGPDESPRAAALAGSRLVRLSARDSAARSADRDTIAVRLCTSAVGALSLAATGESESARFVAAPGDWITPVATATPVAAAARPVRVTAPRSALRAVPRFSPRCRGPDRPTDCAGTGAARGRGDCRTRGSRSGGHVLRQLGHQGGGRGALGAGQRDVGEERVSLELLDHGDDSVVPADAEVVALGDVVGQHDLGVRADPGE